MLEGTLCKRNGFAASPGYRAPIVAAQTLSRACSFVAFRRVGLLLYLSCSVIVACGCDARPVGGNSAERRARLDGNTGDMMSVRVGNVVMEFARILPGEFLMGSDVTEKGRLRSEGPPRAVTISKAFFIASHETTQEQYEAIMGRNPSRFVTDHPAILPEPPHSEPQPRRPVESVTWYQAAEFCDRLSARLGVCARLPTEAEWEYACRAGTASAFSVGPTLRTHEANFNGSQGDMHPTKEQWPQQTQRVGTYHANPFGLYDMHGNVSEWCLDWYQGVYENLPVVDPRGASTGISKVHRGGDWRSEPRYCRSAARAVAPREFRNSTLGFRVVLEDMPKGALRKAGTPGTGTHWEGRQGQIRE